MSNNKIVLITGGAKRIGAVFAQYFAKNNYDVAIHYNSSEKEAKKLCEKLSKYNVRTLIVKANLLNEKETAKIIPYVNKELGKITCLVNNASAFFNDDAKSLDRDIWDKNMEINLRAPFVLSAMFAAQLGKEKGNIINMLDYCVLNYSDKFVSYTLSKSALWSLTQISARTLAPNIRVNGIGPGHSLQNEREKDEKFKNAIKNTPLKHSAPPEELCNALDFILKSPSLTGQILAMDGGKHLIGAEFY